MLCSTYTTPDPPTLFASLLTTATGQLLEHASKVADEMDIDRVYAYNWRGRSPIIPSEAELAAAMERGKNS